MASDAKELASAAKQRGNALFAKKTREDYEKALVEYQEAIKHDPEDHVFHANCSACHIEIAGDNWDPRKKVESYAHALGAARECTRLGPAWPKGYVRQALAEFELIAAVGKWEERKKQDEKWRKEDEERARKDKEAGREPIIPDRSEDAKPELDPELKAIVDSTSYAACEASCRKGLELDPKSEPLRVRLQVLRDAGYVTDEAKDREIRDTDAAAALKAQGNTATSAKKWKEAAEFYTKALEQDPFDHVFYSNRSACYAELEEFEKALRDAEKCIALNPAFGKGYSRQAHALFNVGRYVDMEIAAKKGLEIDASNSALQEMLKQAQMETQETPEVQAHMHSLRQQKRQDAKLQDLMKGLNMGGQNIQMFNPGDDLSGLLNGLKGGGGGVGYGGFGGSGKARMTEEQMRGMARAMSQSSSSKPATEDNATNAPSAFSPK